MKDNASQEHTVQNALQTINDQKPTLAYWGFAFWAAWNLIAFSGNIWLNDIDSSWRISDLFNIHLGASIITLLAVASVSDRLTPLLMRNRSLMIGSSIAFAGTILIIVSGPALIPSAPLFYVGCCFTGVGTSLLFLRSAALFGALTPRKAFIQISQCMLFAGAVYCIVHTMPHQLALICFACLPIASAVMYCLRPKTIPEETVVLVSKTHLTGQFRNFLAAIVVFAAASQTLKSTLIVLPPSESVLSSDYMLVMLIFTCIVFIVGCLIMKSTFNFGVVYRPATLTIIALLIIVPLANFDALISGSLSSMATYTFNIMVWGILSYIVFQAQGDAIRVFAFGNAALAAGSLVGNILSILLVSTKPRQESYLAVCLILALAAIVMALAVFPEYKLKELLLPIDESLFETKEYGDKAAPWKEACRRVAKAHGLSTREAEIFLQLARGKTTQQVSEDLVISPYTTRAHIRNIYSKLNVHSRDELTKLVDHERQRSQRV